MIRAFYGLARDPFAYADLKLLAGQQEIVDTLRVHAQQGGLCLVLGVPGSGKTTIKEHLQAKADPKRALVVTIGRTLHTYPNTLRLLCQAFQLEAGTNPFAGEKTLVEQAFSLNRQGKSLMTIIDDAHLLEMQTLRRLRLLFGDFPKNHNLVLIGQPTLMAHLALQANEDIRSRVTYSVVMKRLNPDDMESFIHSLSRRRRARTQRLHRRGGGPDRALVRRRPAQRPEPVPVVPPGRRPGAEPHHRHRRRQPRAHPAALAQGRRLALLLNPSVPVCRPEDKAPRGRDPSAEAVFRSRRGRGTAPFGFFVPVPSNTYDGNSAGNRIRIHSRESRFGTQSVKSRGRREAP